MRTAREGLSSRVSWPLRVIRTRLDKPSRAVRIGDVLVFAIGGRLTALTVSALGIRRGPPAEARTLYRPLENS